MPKKSAEPWEKPAPKKSKHTKLTPASKAKAKALAKKSGRTRPSLVDNMNAAKAQKKKAAPKKAAPSKKAAPKKASSARAKKPAQKKSAASSA